MHLDYQTLKKWMDESKIPADIIQAHPSEPIEHLRVRPPLAHVGEWPIEVDMIIQGVDIVGYFEPYKNIELLQMYIRFPFDSEPGERLDVLHLVNILNKICWIAGFGFGEESNRVFFRYSVPITGNQEMDRLVINSYLNLFVDCAEIFGPAIADVAVGAMSFEELSQWAAFQSGAEQISQGL